MFRTSVNLPGGDGRGDGDVVHVDNVNVDNGNHHRRERNGTPRQLNNVDNSHHSNNSGNLGLLELLEFVKDSGN